MISDELTDILRTLRFAKLNLSNEKITQLQVARELSLYKFDREFRLDKHNIPDFYHHEMKLAIEVKIKGGRMNIFRQCARYCEFEQVKILILCTNKSMGLPDQINGKPCYYIHIGKAWL